MESGKNPPSDQQRIWELEEQLDDEQYAHRKTKSALRNAQQQLERMSIVGGDQKDCGRSEKNGSKLAEMEKTIEDLRRENSRLVVANNKNVKSMEMLKQENEDLTNMMKVKDLEMSDKLHQYESDIEELKRRNGELQDANRSHILAVRYTETMRIEKENLEEELKRKNEEIKKLNEYWMKKTEKIKDLECLVKSMELLKRENVDLQKMMRKKLRDQVQKNEANLKELKKKNEVIEKLNAVMVEKSDKIAAVEKTIEDLREKCSSLEKSNNENLEKLEHNKMRLEEYQEEVNHLQYTKTKIAECCNTVTLFYWRFIDKSISRLKAGNSPDAEELKQMRNGWSEERQWWFFYLTFDYVLTSAFDAIQKMNKNPDYIPSLENKNSLDFLSEELRKTVEMKPSKKWIEREISTGEKYFAKLEQRVEEAEKRMNKS